VFYNRLKWFAIAMTAVAVVIVVRLIDIQVVRAAQFEALADRMLTRPVRYLPAPRGSILDRNGRLLVSDEPTWDVAVHYALLRWLAAQAESADSPDLIRRDTPQTDAPAQRAATADLPPVTLRYVRALARRLRRAGEIPPDRPRDAVVRDLLARIERTWEELERITGRARDEMVQNAVRICGRIERIREQVRRRRPTVRAVAEENELHPVLRNLSNEVALRVREALERDPWIRVVPSSQRVGHDVDSLVHVVGRLGAASPQRIAQDPLADDPLRALKPGDRCGISGVERLAELHLRGTRGYIREDFDGTIEEQAEPQRGGDVRLTIDVELQLFVLERLKQAVDESQHPCGGAAVVIDVRTRDVLALVSYPVYEYGRFGEQYEQLRADARWQPLRFRAVANTYPPGSTCKVIALYGALAEGLVGPDTTIDCDGYFLPRQPNKFRCWIYNQYGATHGPQTTEDAVRNSCNIFFYTIGDRLGPHRLCAWFARFGLGRTQGTGLIEEARGIVPSEEWLGRTQRRTFRRSDAWNYAIGQGEVTATPLQAANVAATIASGRWEPVRLALDEQGQPIAPDDLPEPVEFDESYLRTIRRGMWRVVNERGGTGYAARLDHPNHVLCGKTGSAQAVPRPVRRRWYLEWPDGRRETVVRNVAVTREELLAEFADPKPRITGWRTDARFPDLGPDEKLPAHAWFIGFTQARRTPRGSSARGKVYAISVIVEYGGSGGKVAGPVARDIARFLLERQREWG